MSLPSLLFAPSLFYVLLHMSSLLSLPSHLLTLLLLKLKVHPLILPMKFLSILILILLALVSCLPPYSPALLCLPLSLYLPLPVLYKGRKGQPPHPQTLLSPLPPLLFYSVLPQNWIAQQAPLLSALPTLTLRINCTQMLSQSCPLGR